MADFSNRNKCSALSGLSRSRSQLCPKAHFHLADCHSFGEDEEQLMEQHALAKQPKAASHSQPAAQCRQELPAIWQVGAEQAACLQQCLLLLVHTCGPCSPKQSPDPEDEPSKIGFQAEISFIFVQPINTGYRCL